MSIFKRGGKWHIDIQIGNQKRIRESTGLEATAANKAAARAFHDKIRAEQWLCTKGGERPRKLWQDAVVKWCDEKADKKSISDDVSMFRWLHRYFEDKPLDTLTRDVIDGVLKIKEGEASASRANRYAALIRAVMNKAAHEWTEGKFHWLERAPKVRMRKEKKHRIFYLNQTQYQRLADELPQHLLDAMVFTVQTGLRASNGVNLAWSQIDMQNHTLTIHGDDMKAGRTLGVPLNSIAMEILERRLKENRQGVYVFEYAGKKMSRFNSTGWVKAVERAGLKGFRWHDLRHTWASWHVQNGTPLHVLQQLGGWQTYAMVQVYAHLSPRHMVKDVERIVPLQRHG